jgi:hypothetical protein
MIRIFLGTAVAVALGLLTQNVHGQQKLQTKGWGSLSGKVTLKGEVPPVVDWTEKMKLHDDKACCLDPKAKLIEKVDPTWIVDPKTKAVANVVVWIKAPAGTYLPTHADFKKKREPAVIDQPHCAFVPHIAAYNPVQYDDDGKLTDSGQKLIIKNSATVAHNVRAIGHPLFNPGFNFTWQPKTEMEKTFKPQHVPVELRCDIHTWMSARLFVFDHPYYAITKADGTYEIPLVPAGAEVGIMMYHEEPGYLLTREGRKMKIAEGKNTLDYEITR